LNKSRVLKYLCKYVNKGPDKPIILFEQIKKGNYISASQNNEGINEINEYLECRYICELYALWRLLGFEIHYHMPSVERLPVHLPFMNNIVYKENTNLKVY
jgi:hypothetical protein